MKQLKFDDFFSFILEVSDVFDELTVKDEDVDIAIIAKYDEARRIIPELLSMDYDMESVELHRPSWEDYFDEYIISLNRDGIWCEPMKRDNGYLNNDSTITYILDNCSSKVIPYCKGKTVYEVTVGADEDEECGCDECGCACKKDEKPTTTTSSTTYRVNGKEVDKVTYESALADIEDKCLDNVRDMLLGYCEIMDEMNEWRKLLEWW